MHPPKKLKYIYGPVWSWRLGSSLGVDLLSGTSKACSFDCVYCQLGRARTVPAKRKVFVPTKKVIAEIKALPKRARIDYITFSGSGEPTLARNLGPTIKAIKKLRPEPVAVLTNASLIHRKDVRRELALADLVAVKLDAGTEEYLQLINHPAEGVSFKRIVSGIRQFRRQYRGRFTLQIMFLRRNRFEARAIARLAKDIRPDQIQICTPVRPSAAVALSPEELLAIKKLFPKANTISHYDRRQKKLKPFNIKATLRRRGKK